MKLKKPKWSWPVGAGLRYSVKVTLATLLGYVLSFGEPAYAVFGAFSAALVVGENRGEDVGSAANRARGSLAGMVVGVAFAHLPIPAPLAVALSIGATAYLCIGWNWGKTAARIGASLCAVTVLMHANDALAYSALRVGNTVIGIVAGLAVSYFVLPVSGRDAVARSVTESLDAVARLLDALRPDQPLEVWRYGDVLRSLVGLEKSLTDARHEIGGEAEVLLETSRNVALACVGSLSAAIAYAELRGSPGGIGEALPMCERATALAQRAKSLVPGGRREPPQARSDPSPEGYDETARQGFALGLRKVDHALASLGR